MKQVGLLLAAATVVATAGVSACTPPGPTPVTCGGTRATVLVPAGAPYAVFGTAGPDVIAVTGGVHQVFGGSGNDLICAGPTGTTLVGGPGNDRLVGGSGRDRLDGGPGNDTLSAAGGDDVLIGGSGADVLDGGPGEDLASYADHTMAVSATLNGRADDGGPGERDTLAASVEDVLGGGANDTITGSSAANLLMGGGGNDRILGGPGNDRLQGQAGNDSLAGQAGRDALDGGSGTNFCDADALDGTAADCTFDSAAPYPVTLEVLTPQVDLAAGQRSVQVRTRVTDDSSGVAYVVVRVCDPSGRSRAGAFISRTSGTAADGTYDGTLDLPDGAPGGTYVMCQLSLQDAAWNEATYAAAVNDADGRGHRLLPMTPPTFTVIGGTVVDTQAPRVSDIRVTSSAGDVTKQPIDVTSDDVAVTVEWTVTENGSGIESSAPYLAGSSQQHWGEGVLVTPNPEAAPGSGRYRSTIVVPRGSVAGWWRTVVYARDRQDNSVVDDSTPFTVIDADPVEDLPVLSSPSVTPDPQGGVPTLAINIRGDRASVKRWATLWVVGPHGQPGYISISQTGGTATDGVWSGPAELPSGAYRGVWTTTQIVVEDSLGRFMMLKVADHPLLRQLTWTVN